METDMITFVDKKFVKVTDRGPIMPLGGIYGPTLPQIMTVRTIAILLQKGYHVTEILNNKTEIVLSLSNYNVDLNGDGGKSLKDVKRPNEDIKPMPKKNAKVESPAPEEKTEKPATKEPVKVEPAVVENKITVSAAGGKAEAESKRNDNDAGGLMSTKKNRPKADELTSK